MFNSPNATTTWTRLLVLILIILPAILFVVGTIGMLLFIYLPSDIQDNYELPPLGKNSHLIVIAHGMKDSPESWGYSLKNQLENNSDQSAIAVIDWSGSAKNPLTCSVNATRIGGQIASQLSGFNGLKSVHLIGHSCGSFLIQGVCDALTQTRPEIKMQNTFLAPVSIYGGVHWDYGLANFGNCGDFNEVYVDSGDKGPGQYQWWPRSFTFDVTDVRVQSDYRGSPHLWPITYYQGLVAKNSHPLLQEEMTISSRLVPGGKKHVAFDL